MQGTKRWRLFSLRGHEVYLDITFLVLVLLFTFIGVREASDLPSALLIAPIIFFGVLIHEFGHAIAIKAFNYGPSTIVLGGFGGVTINRRRGQNSAPGKSIMISAAGPLASLLLCLLSLVALVVSTSGSFSWELLLGAQSPNLWHDFLAKSAMLNGFWFLFNMLPVNPMDGGHIVLHSLRLFLGDWRRATLYSAYSSLAAIVVITLIVFQLFGTPFFLLFIMLYFAFQNWQIIRQIKQQPAY